MKHNKDHHKSSSATHIDMMFAEELHELADAIEEIKNTPTNISAISDPFDEYMDSMSSRIFADKHNFRTRFIKGYNILFHHIQNEGESQNKSL